MPKNIVFFSDGTGNEKGRDVDTNIAWLSDHAENMRTHLPTGDSARLAANRRTQPTWQELEDDPEALDRELARPDVRQITHYDPGIGTEFGDFMGKATGSGITQNIKDGYDFIVRFYEPGDRIFLFGFSRGAYTVRSLAGLIGLCGVVRRRAADGSDRRHDARARAGMVEEAYAIYKIGQGEKERDRRLKAGMDFREAHAYDEHARDPAAWAPYFIGVFDTVRALGIGLKGWELTFRPHRFHDHSLNPYVRYAYQALSIDDPRKEFWPTLWDEPSDDADEQARAARKKQIMKQRWFPGVHSDVGGGYRDRRLGDIALSWMLDRATRAEHPLHLRPDKPIKLAPDANGDIHDPMRTLGERILYTRAARKVCQGRHIGLSTDLERTGHALLHRAWAQRRLAQKLRYRTPYLDDDPRHPHTLIITKLEDEGRGYDEKDWQDDD